MFILNNGTSITKYDYTKKDDCVVYHNSDYGPIFCGNIELYISNNYLNNQDSYFSLDLFSDDLGGKNPFISEDHSTKNYKLKELEVFKLFN